MQSFRRDSVSRCFVKCEGRAVCFAHVVLLAFLCFLEVPWDLEASLERLGAAVGVS